MALLGLTSVTIGNAVQTIGDSAFAFCSGLTKVINYRSTPQAINSSVFYGVDKTTCILYVPDESIDDYRATIVWKQFLNIKPISEYVGINGTRLEETLTAYSQNGILHISGLQVGERFSVYTVSGIQVYEGVAVGATHALLLQNVQNVQQKRIYIIKQGTRAVKIAVN